MLVPPHPLISASVAEADKCYLSGAGELILFILAVALLRRLLHCLSGAIGTSCDSMKRALIGRKSRRPSAVKRQPRPVRVKASAVLPFNSRRPVDAREALRRSSGGCG